VTMTQTTLEDFLTAQAAPPAEPVTDEERARFSIDGPRLAGWALRRLARAEGEAARIRSEAADRIALVKQWETQALAGPTRDATFFEGLLTDWHRRQLEPALAEALDRYTAAHPDASPDEALAAVWKKVDAKTVKLPDGTISARKTPEGVEVVDADAVVAWAVAEGHADLVRQTPALAELKRLPRSNGVVVSPDGDPVPGVVPKPGRIDYSAKVELGLERPAWEPPPSEEE
jgi:phage host-nuclease inhibitor protein Gam